MYNFHCHTFYSDGVLSPSELLYRCYKIGYKAVGIADHADESNFEFIIKNIKKVTTEFNKKNILKAFCGIELTYVLPGNISKVAKECRKIGADLIVVHGETIVEPVPENTNYNAVKSDIDILAHPGFIDKKTLNLAKKNNILIEITSRAGHSYTNGYVFTQCKKNNNQMIFSTDAHSPENLIDKKFADLILKGAGANNADIKQIWKNAENLINKMLKK